MVAFKKRIWAVLALIAAFSAILAYVAADDSVLVQWIDAGVHNRLPLSVHTGLVQSKVLQGSEGKVGVTLTLTGTNVIRQDRRWTRHADLVIVLDRSGSMQGRKIEDARKAVIHLINRLTPSDRLSLVTYANGVDTAFPLMAMDNDHRKQVKATVGQIYAGGGTNLGGGLQQGIHTLLINSAKDRQRKVILISDGLANHGVTEPTALGGLASNAAEHHCSVSTVGVGYDFNEIVMTTIADHGAGSYYFLEHPDAFARVFEKEMESARRVVASGLQIRIPLKNGFQLVHAGGYPIETQNGYALVQAGDLLSGQTRKLFLTLHVPTDDIRSIDLGTIDVRYQDNGTTRAISSSETLRIACVADEKAVLSSIDQIAWGEQVIKEDYNRLREEVATAIRKGQKDKALKQICTYEARNRRINQSVASPEVSTNLQRDVTALRQSVIDTFAGPPEAVQQKKKKQSKALQYESYKIRRDKQ